MPYANEADRTLAQKARRYAKNDLAKDHPQEYEVLLQEWTARLKREAKNGSNA